MNPVIFLFGGNNVIKYSCKEMGLNCSFLIKGETLEEVTLKALEHVREKHESNFNSIHTPEEIERMKQALARSTWLAE
jgi:predicted small metal-binding protein